MKNRWMYVVGILLIVCAVGIVAISMKHAGRKEYIQKESATQNDSEKGNTPKENPVQDSKEEGLGRQEFSTKDDSKEENIPKESSSESENEPEKGETAEEVIELPFIPFE